MSNFRIPIHVAERHGLSRTGEAIRTGVPLPRALLYSTADVEVRDSDGNLVAHQARPLALWSDRSVKWLLVDALVNLEAHQRTSVFMVPRSGSPETPPIEARLQITEHGGRIEIQTGGARFQIAKAHAGPFVSVTLENLEVLRSPSTDMRLVGEDDSVARPVAERLVIEEAGPVRATVFSEGWFQTEQRRLPLHFRSRTVFTAGSATVSYEFQLRNVQAASHRGGTWDLGDPGSWHFKDLTLALYPASSGFLRWQAEPTADEHDSHQEPLTIYQDSSGGENWNSPNHLDRNATSTVSFRGYRVTSDRSGHGTVTEGYRATPVATLVMAEGWISASIRDFWQNFPKALRWKDAALSVGLFPGEARTGFELQGGEQKRHTVWLDFGRPPQQSCIQRLQHPVAVSVDPGWVEDSRAITWFVARSSDEDRRYIDYVQHIIEGPHSFVDKREIIDEFGWRNFGELYADHESVRHQGPGPFVSHYNNQYDFIYGAFVHFKRTGDARWHELMRHAAEHVIDIDVYHTQADKAAFNGGLFWHTDHYLPAVTCTHRGYSRHNRGSGDYGGGPSNEQNYTSGLLHYYYQSGDQEAARTVQELADYVLALDDGSQTLFAVIDDGPTGGASQTVEASYHKPGRGAGNSINALLDAYTLTRDRRYFAKVEELVRRCIHPRDDIAALRLDDPEHRWSYLVFLQVLGKYLEIKRELGEIDYTFHYARESLLHYAEWMVHNEVPYKDVLHKVEIPTETWPAHDIRKCHVLHVAAEYSAGDQRTRLRERAEFFFNRCVSDVTEFSTAFLTRPLVILCVYGSIHHYFRKHGGTSPELRPHNYEFGSPIVFVPQRARLRASLAAKIRTLGREVQRLLASSALPRFRRP